MKKIKSGLLMLALTIGIAGAFASAAPKAPSHKFTSLYWYPVNPATDEITGAEEYHDTKANVVAEQGCQDLTSTICLFGSASSSLPIGTNVGNPSSADRINQSN